MPTYMIHCIEIMFVDATENYCNEKARIIYIIENKRYIWDLLKEVKR